MTTSLTLFDLFGESTIAGVAGAWPQRVQPETGFEASWPPPSLSAWLGALNNAIVVSDVRTGANGDRVAVEAKLAMPGSAAYPDGFPFVIGSMPDVEFRIQPATAGENLIQLFASMSDRGIELVLERVPVEIRLPAGLIDPHPQPGGDIPDNTPTFTVGDFRPGHLDDLKIGYDRDQPASIFVHIRVHMTEDGDFDIRSAVPVSFGKCVFSGMPCLALHDFQLIPSPTIAPHNVHWLRHEVTPWAPTLTGPLDGSFSIRSVYIDPDTAPIKDFTTWLNGHGQAGDDALPPLPPPVTGTSDAHGELVLDDLVVPFYSPWALPIPRHVTVGVRRRILDKDDPKQVFTFDNAPVRAYFSHNPEVGFLVEDFFFKSDPSEVGLTFDAAFTFGSTHDDAGKSDAMALGIGLEEHYTPTLSYKRDFSSATGMPQPGTGAAATLNALLHWEIATITIDIMTIRIGFSLGRFFGENASFLDSSLATVDLFVKMPPTGSDTSFIKLRSLNGEDTKFIIEGLGWRLGSFHLEGVALPDGVIIIIAQRFGLVLQELGLRAEDSATYLSFSGGILISLPSGFAGGLTVKRLRFRIAGNAGAPPVKLDGFFLLISTSSFRLEAGGYYTESTTDGVTVREFALTGTIAFDAGVTRWTFGFDFLIGHVSSATDNFEYLFAQLFFKGSIPIYSIELRGIRVLFARNMKPLLQPLDQQSRELRYYTWYKNSDPLTVPGDRRMAAWIARDDSVAVGVGASVSFAGFGTIAEVGAFVLFVKGPDEHALLIVMEIRLLHGPKPIGYLAIETDFANDMWRGVLGVDLKLADFVTEAPDWLSNIGSLTGSLFIGNKPGTVAIGRLVDQKTWLLLHLDYDFFVRTFFEAGLCVELVENGPKGVGFFVRVEGGVNAGVVKVVYHAGFGMTFEFFDTASHDFAAQIFVEAGLRVIVFGFLHFGISASSTFRLVGTRPSRGEMQCQIRFETPWFLPDVTWTFEFTFGILAPSDLATSTSPLRAAGGTQGLLQKSATLHVERFDPNYANDRASRTFSVNELKAGGPDEATRLANFEADAAVRPIATDSTVAVEFAVAVNDTLALSSGVAPNLGDKTSGDLTLYYDLIAIEVRRRARFGLDRSWYQLDQRLEIPPDFSDPTGVQLTGTFETETISAQWDIADTIDGQPATKRLLINSSTPFQFKTNDPAADEELIRFLPTWPCCSRKEQMRVHRLSFDHEMLGADIDTPRLFSDSASRFTYSRQTIARPQRVGTSLPPTTIVAESVAFTPGVIANIAFDEAVAYCSLRVGWTICPGLLSFVAFDATGNVVGTKSVLTNPASDFQTILVGAQGPIRRIEIRAVFGASGAISTHASLAVARPRMLIEIASAQYVGLRDYLTWVRDTKFCGGSGNGGGYEGKGKLFFLPNHEYEIALTTRVTVSHPSTTPDSAEVPEYLYFKTKGLPGLNAVQRVGEEVEPYVAGAYGGGRGLLYRSEPVVVAFNEDFYVAVPLALRPAGTEDEHTALMRMQLLVRADTAVSANTPFTATSPDWIVAHRVTIPPFRLPAWDVRASLGTTQGTAMRSVDPFRERLAILTQRDSASCPVSDPRDVVGTALIAPPQGDTDPDDATKELWPAALQHTATVRLEGAPFVERVVFESADLTAMQFSLDSSTDVSGAWHVVDGKVSTDPGTARRFAIFGEGDWNHVAITVSISLGDDGTAAGIAIALPPTGAPSAGLFALIETVFGGLRLALYRRTTGSQMTALAQAPLPPATEARGPITLTVTAFDDVIRAAVGEESIEADRDEQREGRVALVATGATTLSNLSVAGVAIYAFPFTTSRYRTFHEHIQSWPGTLDAVGANALGAGTTTNTVAGLWSATESDVLAAMQAEADRAARDAVFGRWAKELGLPLKDEVSRVEISRLDGSGGVLAFLIESPEPIDFTQEVTATLAHRVKSHGGIIVDPVPGTLGGLFGARGAAAKAPTSLSAATEVAREFARAEANSTSTAVAPTHANPPLFAITDVAHLDRAIDVELSIAGSPSLGDDRVVFIERADEDGPPRLRIYTGRVTVPRRTRGVRRAGAPVARVRAVETDDVTVLRVADSILAGGAVSGLSCGGIVGFLPGLGGIGFGGHGGVTFHYEPVRIQIIQDGSACHALIIPLSSTAVPVTLGAGRYRLTLAIDRVRWSTTAPPDDLTRYRDSATLTIEL